MLISQRKLMKLKIGQKWKHNFLVVNLDEDFSVKMGPEKVRVAPSFLTETQATLLFQKLEK